MKRQDYLTKAEEIFAEIGAAKDLFDLRSLTGQNMPDKSTVSLKEKREMTFILETSRTISSILDINKLLFKVLDSAVEITGAERGFLFLVGENNELELKLARNIDKTKISSDEFTTSRNIIDKVRENRKPLLITDAQTDSRFSAKESIVKYNLRSIMCIPLISKDKLIGILYLDNRLVSKLFSDREMELMIPLATQAAISIENARAVKKIEDLTKQMARSEKLATLGKLGGVISHEIRNPLGAIKNCIYYLNMEFVDKKDKELDNVVKTLDKETNRCFSIVEDILSFVRIKMPELKDIDTTTVLKDSLARIPVPMNIHVEEKLAPDLHHVLADKMQLEQVFGNLIQNAFQAMPEGGGLTIEAHNKDSFVEILFTDTGSGITPENMKKIFDLLFTTKKTGTGFGLSICQTIIEGMGGKIEVESPPRRAGEAGQVGKGTTFKVRLPAAS